MSEYYKFSEKGMSNVLKNASDLIIKKENKSTKSVENNKQENYSYVSLGTATVSNNFANNYNKNSQFLNSTFDSKSVVSNAYKLTPQQLELQQKFQQLHIEQLQLHLHHHLIQLRQQQIWKEEEELKKQLHQQQTVSLNSIKPNNNSTFNFENPKNLFDCSQKPILSSLLLSESHNSPSTFPTYDDKNLEIRNPFKSSIHHSSSFSDSCQLSSFENKINSDNNCHKLFSLSQNELNGINSLKLNQTRSYNYIKVENIKKDCEKKCSKPPIRFYQDKDDNFNDTSADGPDKNNNIDSLFNYNSKNGFYISSPKSLSSSPFSRVNFPESLQPKLSSSSSSSPLSLSKQKTLSPPALDLSCKKRKFLTSEFDKNIFKSSQKYNKLGVDFNLENENSVEKLAKIDSSNKVNALSHENSSSFLSPSYKPGSILKFLLSSPINQETPNSFQLLPHHQSSHIPLNDHDHNDNYTEFKRSKSNNRIRLRSHTLSVCDHKGLKKYAKNEIELKDSYAYENNEHSRSYDKNDAFSENNICQENETFCFKEDKNKENMNTCDGDYEICGEDMNIKSCKFPCEDNYKNNRDMINDRNFQKGFETQEGNYKNKNKDVSSQDGHKSFEDCEHKNLKNKSCQVKLANKISAPVLRFVMEQFREIVRFCLSLSEYQQLPFHDQTILLLCSSAKLLLLNMAQLNFTFAITPVCDENGKNNEEIHENSDINKTTKYKEIDQTSQGKNVEKCDEKHQFVENKLHSAAFNKKNTNNETSKNNTKKSFAQTFQNISSSGHKDSYPTQRFVDLVQTFISKCQSQLITDDEYHLLKCIVLFQIGSEPLMEKDCVTSIYSKCQKSLQTYTATHHANERLRFLKLLLSIYTLHGIDSKLVEVFFFSSDTKTSLDKFLMQELEKAISNNNNNNTNTNNNYEVNKKEINEHTGSKANENDTVKE